MLQMGLMSSEATVIFVSAVPLHFTASVKYESVSSTLLEILSSYGVTGQAVHFWQ